MCIAMIGRRSPRSRGHAASSADWNFATLMTLNDFSIQGLPLLDAALAGARAPDHLGNVQSSRRVAARGEPRRVTTRDVERSST